MKHTQMKLKRKKCPNEIEIKKTPQIKINGNEGAKKNLRKKSVVYAFEMIIFGVQVNSHQNTHN